jgi:DNA gyrase subunit A
MDMMALTKAGKMIRVDMQTISKSSRNTSGVYIVKGDEVASISRCIKEEKSEDEDEELSAEIIEIPENTAPLV